MRGRQRFQANSAFFNQNQGGQEDCVVKTGGENFIAGSDTGNTKGGNTWSQDMSSGWSSGVISEKGLMMAYKRAK